jgi:HD-like signal output (HDOD) protein
LRARVDGELGLPLLSDIAGRVMAVCQDARGDLQELADLVTHDQSLAVHILRVANSAAYAPRGPILSLQQAIGRLGLSTVRDVAIAALSRSVSSRFWLPPAFATCGCTLRNRVLREGGCSTAAQELDSAFLCGLLHDVGMPIVMRVVCDMARNQASDPVPTPVVERPCSGSTASSARRSRIGGASDH